MRSVVTCVFCAIVNGTEPATIRYQTDQVMVIDNRLSWTPVMLLVIPKEHITQEEMWTDAIVTVSKIAIEVGNRFCPDGYRIVSNFGYDALQTQDHGHMHVVGGKELGPYA